MQDHSRIIRTLDGKFTLDITKERFLAQYREEYLNSIYDGYLEVWWRGFLHIFVTEYPDSVMDRRFVGFIRYLDSVQSLRVVCARKIYL